MAGLVSGRTTIVVTPPAAAASPAERKLSLCRSPGSPIFTPQSTMPGARQWPPQSMTRAEAGAGPLTAWITPSASVSAPGLSVPASGSIRRALVR